MDKNDTQVTIDHINKQFITTFNHLNYDQLNWKPNPETWSIAQIIDHLIVINESYFSIFEKLKSGEYKPPFQSKIGFLVNLFGKMILKSVEPKTKKKTKTFPIWEPTTSKIGDDILERFIAHQLILKDYLKALEPLATNGAVISSPANKNIVYQLSTAFDIILKHELRHFEQAKKLNEQLMKTS